MAKKKKQVTVNIDDITDMRALNILNLDLSAPASATLDVIVLGEDGRQLKGDELKRRLEILAVMHEDIGRKAPSRAPRLPDFDSDANGRTEPDLPQPLTRRGRAKSADI